jgi:transposase
MKNLPSNPVPPRPRRFDEEYIRQALALWQSSGRSGTEIAAQLGIRRPLLYKWAAQQRRAEQPERAAGSGRDVASLEAEIQRLREENAKLLEHREILKKSLGIFSELPPRGMPKSNR